MLTRDGVERRAKILLNAGSNLLAKDTDDTADEPDSGQAIAYVREQTSVLSRADLAPVTDFPAFHSGDDRSI